jgi:hypothetical protein
MNAAELSDATVARAWRELFAERHRDLSAANAALDAALSVVYISPDERDEKVDAALRAIRVASDDIIILGMVMTRAQKLGEEEG